VVIIIKTNKFLQIFALLLVLSCSSNSSCMNRKIFKPFKQMLSKLKKSKKIDRDNSLGVLAPLENNLIHEIFENTEQKDLCNFAAASKITNELFIAYFKTAKTDSKRKLKITIKLPTIKCLSAYENSDDIVFIKIKNIITKIKTFIGNTDREATIKFVHLSGSMETEINKKNLGLNIMRTACEKFKNMAKTNRKTELVRRNYNSKLV